MIAIHQNKNKLRETKSNNVIDRAILIMGIAYAVFLVWAILWKCGVPFIGDGDYVARVGHPESLKLDSNGGGFGQLRR